MRVRAGNFDLYKFASFYIPSIFQVHHTINFRCIGGAAGNDLVFPDFVHLYGHAFTDLAGKAYGADFFLYRHETGATFLLFFFRDVTG